MPNLAVVFPSTVQALGLPSPVLRLATFFLNWNHIIDFHLFWCCLRVQKWTSAPSSVRMIMSFLSGWLTGYHSLETQPVIRLTYLFCRRCVCMCLCIFYIEFVFIWNDIPTILFLYPTGWSMRSVGISLRALRDHPAMHQLVSDFKWTDKHPLSTSHKLSRSAEQAAVSLV